MPVGQNPQDQPRHPTLDQTDPQLQETPPTLLARISPQLKVRNMNQPLLERLSNGLNQSSSCSEPTKSRNHKPYCKLDKSLQQSQQEMNTSIQVHLNNMQQPLTESRPSLLQRINMELKSSEQGPCTKEELVSLVSKVEDLQNLMGIMPTDWRERRRPFPCQTI